MMLKLRVLAGYGWRICLLIICFLSLSTSHAQEENARFLWGISDEEGFIAHIRLANGLTIESAELVTASESLHLSPRLLSTEQWIILDASRVVINTAPAIQAAVIDFIGRPEQEIGLIRFASEIESLAPTASDSELGDWLGDYRARSSESGCLGDALQWLNEQPRPRDRARQVLAIVGEYQTCDYPAVDYPVEILVLGADAEAYGGNASQVSLQSLRPNLNRIKAAWAEPLFALEGSRPNESEGNLNITLSNGETVSVPINYEIVIPPTLAPTSAATEAPIQAPSAEPSRIAASETPVAESQETQVAAVETSAPMPTASLEAEIIPEPLPVNNEGLIIGGGLAAALVVVVVMGLLLKQSRRKRLPEAKAEIREPIILDKTMPATPKIEPTLLDMTHQVSLRDMLSTVRQTLSAQLIDEAGTVYEIHYPSTTLGRREDSDIRILNDKQISREHLRFTVREDGSIWLTRLSQNPVLLNDMAVENTVPVKSGDILQLSPNLRLKLEMVSHD